jgi:hypothetical protein
LAGNKREYYSDCLFDAQGDTTVQYLIKTKEITVDADTVGAEQYKKLVEQTIEYSNDKKRDVKNVFDPIMEEHFRLCVQICGMTRPGEMNTRKKIYGGAHVAHSIADDPSIENIKRLAWTVFYSCLTAHKKIFNNDMSVAYERIIMEQLNVGYKPREVEDGKVPKKGCVSMYINRILNKYRCNLRDGMTKNASCTVANVCTNMPKGWQGPKPKPKDCACLFWVATKLGPNDDLTNIPAGTEFIPEDKITGAKGLGLLWRQVSLEWLSEKAGGDNCSSL